MGRIWLLVLLGGCRQLFGFEEPIRGDAGSPPTCVDEPCTVGVCHPIDGICVECVVGDDCPSSQPVCNPVTNACEICDAHDDCPSDVCDLRSGECIAEGDVIYVDGSGDGVSCDRDAPCGTLNAAFAQVSATRSFMKVSGSVSDTMQTNALGPVVTIFGAPGATVSRTTGGNTLQMNGSTVVSIFDLAFVGAAANGNAIVVNDSQAILHLERVVIRGHGTRGVLGDQGARVTMRSCVVTGNAGGGVELENVVIELVNNVVVRNGAPGSNFGGLRLRPPAGSVVQFNTIADNISPDPQRSGVDCVAPFVASNNIVTGNGLGTACTFEFSLFEGVLPPGTGNRLGAPAFASTNPAVVDPSYYRITDASAAIDAADPASTLDRDIDGDLRPQGGAPDIGADEHAP